jgi:hypothetical protein
MEIRMLDSMAIMLVLREVTQELEAYMVSEGEDSGSRLTEVLLEEEGEEEVVEALLEEEMVDR